MESSGGSSTLAQETVLVPTLRRWVVVDLETTGLSAAKGDRIVEIGAVEVVGDQIVGEYATLIDPERSIPYYAQRVHGISDSMVRGAPRFAEALPGFLAFCGESALISHNASFDRGFLDFQARLVMEAPLQHAHLDTLRAARMLLPKLGTHKLDALAQHLGIRLSNHHRALGDARATAEIWIKLEKMAAEQSTSLARAFLRN